MGILGLKSFLERSGKTRPVNIIEEIHRWKSENPQQTPTIVVDFCSLRKHNKKKADFICGAAREIKFIIWDEVFKKLKAAGCSLVFFSDQKIKDKEEKTLIQERFNDRFHSYVDLYDRIDDGQTLQQISDEWMKNFEETTIYRELAVIVKRYGEFRYSSVEECDLELAQYAYHHNAVAVISNDTDFLIYEGPWQLWWTVSNDWSELKTTEYIRKDLEKLLGLSRNQLPLYGTILGSHFTNRYQCIYATLYGFHRMYDAAKYVLKVGNGPLSHLDIKRIAQSVYKDADESTDVIQRSIRSSLDWFDIQVTAPKLDDELAEKFSYIKVGGVDMFRPYMRNMNKDVVILNRYYDFRGCERGTNLTLIQMKWIKRKSGILRKRFHDDAFEITILAQTDVDTTATMIHIEKPDYPNFDLPWLENLYIETEKDDDMDLSDMKWKILSWIMDLPDGAMSKIKDLPNDYVLISTILYTLVKNCLLSVLEADGILYTEYKAIDNETELMNVVHPTVLVSRHVRAAHIYRCVFDSVKENFAIAGLLPLIDRFFNFHGVYYQNLMARLTQMTSAECDPFIAPIEKYRIYVELDTCTAKSS